jgi:transcriptional regulator with XRE-family HTH domain
MQPSEMEPARLVLTARRSGLGFNQAEFCSYLNKNLDLTKRKFTQSTVSKYENGQVSVPAEVIMLCRKVLILKASSDSELDVEALVQGVEQLHPELDKDLIQMIGLILNYRSSMNIA